MEHCKLFVCIDVIAEISTNSLLCLSKLLKAGSLGCLSELCSSNIKILTSWTLFQSFSFVLDFKIFFRTSGHLFRFALPKILLKF